MLITFYNYLVPLQIQLYKKEEGRQMNDVPRKISPEETSLKMVIGSDERVFFQNIWTDAWLYENYAKKDNIGAIIAHHKLFENYSNDFILMYSNHFIGTVRLVWENDQIGIPITNDFEIKKIWSGKITELTLFAVKNSWRERSASVGFDMFKKATAFAKEQQAEGVIVAADHRVLRLMKLLGLELIEIGSGKHYEGSFTIPAFHPL